MRPIKLLTLSVIFALTGCLSLAPDYQRPAAPVPQQFSLSQNKLVTATAGYQETGWRTFFVDPQVKSLISTALTNNRDLRMATLKVQEARAQYRVTDADRYPQLNGDGSTTYGGKLKGDTTTSSDYAAGLNLSYDLDFFGRLKNLSEADRQNFFASEEARRAVHILLIANVSQSYFNQRLAAAQLQVANDTLQNYQQSYAFVEKQLLTGSTTVLALEQARGEIDKFAAVELFFDLQMRDHTAGGALARQLHESFRRVDDVAGDAARRQVEVLLQERLMHIVQMVEGDDRRLKQRRTRHAIREIALRKLF